ncbi:MAG: L-serine ammonia-lyase, iron-sulfur-dependent, subunit alpha, partial [Lentisphaeria bacterium]|nr:L-serine ammonia-lyase, iron-sulfur-dependent, subunit alpha [Lentisphaeria bacterium]
MEILLDREVKKDAASQDVKLALDNIPYIVTRCQIYENLFTNMKNAGVKYIALKRKGSDKPEPVKVEGREVAFSAYPYEMVVRGTLPQIRDFANKLHQEYQNNRVYVVDSFVLSTDSGESAEADPTKRSVEVANSIRIIEELKKSEEIKAKAMEAAAAAAANADDNADRQNAELAQEARKAAVRLEKNYGAQVGKTLLSTVKVRNTDTVRTIAKAYAAAGSDARMNGCAMPVVINSGSGNQGLTVSLPVKVYADTYHISHDRMIRALAVSNLISIHQKQYIGSLSAYCGAVSAACGAGAAIAYLLGEVQPPEALYRQVSDTITNTIATVGGMVCDGAKSSCAAKIAT